ncbi:MAG: DUF4935 domain-containing protein, partial [Campylobacterales bacterium]|nr:DUF4935 domain-containing protein [Campylobacterales bacterium]
MSTFTVLFDTNSIISNKYKIITSQLLSRYIKSELVEVLMTEVVFDEIVKHFASDYQSILDSLEKERTEASKLGIGLTLTVSPNNFEQRLQETIKENNIKIIPIEQADVRSIYSKAFELQKPFKNKKGKESGGIKDAIIWNSMVNYLSNNTTKEKIVFVCNDSDFVDQSVPELHEGLKKDLINAGIELSNFFIARTIQDLISLILEPVEKLTEQQRGIEQELYSSNSFSGISVSDIVLDSYQKMVDNAIVEVIEEHVDSNGGLEIENVDISDYIDVKVTHVRFLGSTVAYVFFSILWKVKFEYLGTRGAFQSENSTNMRIVDYIDFGETGFEPI